MKRRAVKQGTTTLMVSLPAKWARQHKISKGSEVDIEPYGEGLIIKMEGVPAKSQTAVSITGTTESLIRTLITNAYRRGFDIIVVTFQTEEQFRILGKVIKTRLLGFDITKREKNTCIVESISEPAPEQFDTILRKIFYTINELFDITKKRLRGEMQTEDFEEVEERIQKYDNFCRRVLAKGLVQLEASDMLWTFLSYVLHGQRELYHLNKLLNKVKVSSQAMELLDSTKQLFGLIIKVYIEKNMKLLDDIHAKEKQLVYGKGYNLLAEKRGKEALIIHHLLVSIREFYQSNSPLAGLIL